MVAVPRRVQKAGHMIYALDVACSVLTWCHNLAGTSVTSLVLVTRLPPAVPRCATDAALSADR
eukprot:8680683-Pyramimonas_sp.AAC.1